MEFVWKRETERVCFPPLRGSRSVDVLIIGGGIAGLLCALKLKDEGADCIVLEADRILCGVTSNTTAKVTFSHGLIYDKLFEQLGERKARLYFEAQRSAMDDFEELCKNIDCCYEKRDAFVYTLVDRERIDREVVALRRLGADACFDEAMELPFAVKGALRVKGQAQLHPLKLLYSIAGELDIYENTKVTELLPQKAVTQYGDVSFGKVIVATHFPIFNKHGAYFLKMYQHRSYVLALAGADIPSGMYVDECDKGLSFRPYGDLLLLGGGGHRTGKSGGGWRELEDFTKKHYGGARIVGRWATQDCMTLDSVPYVGRYSPKAENMFVATGFNKWGMTNSMAAASLLCDLVRGRGNRYAEIFSPSRSMLHKQLFVNALEAFGGLLRPTVPRCPHLGCALIYNEAEHSWDCPCHGSRFTETGELLDNPATDGKRM